MPLTRHLYELDEVQSSLYYCAYSRDVSQAAFWCNELLISGYRDDAVRILFESWLWQRGPFYLRWMMDSTFDTDEAILSAAAHLSSFGEWDNSLWYLVHEPMIPDRVTPKTPDFPVKTDMERYLVRALFQGKATSAWVASAHVSTAICEEYGAWRSPLYTVCRDRLLQIGERYTMHKTAIRCLSVIMLALSDAKLKSSFAVRTVPTPSVKPGRAYSIPSIALYQSPERDTLHDIEAGIKGCPFWEDALKLFQRGGKWVSGDAMDAFYAEYFPDGIPDEWDANEKKKSHGPRDIMTWARYARVHLMKPRRFRYSTGGSDIVTKPVRRMYVI